MRTALLLAACAALVPTPPSQRLTVVNVAVEHMDGRSVENLSAADFSLQVDGRTVRVEKVTNDSAVLSVAVVLDVTASGFWPGGGAGARAADQTVRDHVLANLRNDTAVLVGSFGRSVRWSGDFSSGRAEQVRQLRSALSLPEAERTGPSPVWDAVNESLAALQLRSGRQAVLLVTDGQATGNRLGLAEVADRAIAAAVSINVVFTGPSGLIKQTGDTKAGVHPERPLIQLASATGGYYAARPSQSIEKAPVDALRKAARAMRSVYRVEFTAPVRTGFQRLVVTTRNPDHRPRAPMGFKNAAAQEP